MLKTLRELADQVGFPFDAVRYRETFHCIGISPNDQKAMGWYFNEMAMSISAEKPEWTIAPKKKVLKSFVYQAPNGNIFKCHEYMEKPEEWCGGRFKLIKILDEIEVDV
jgi:hypothetical protein